MKSIFSEIYKGLDMRGYMLKGEEFGEDDGAVYDLEDELENELTEELKEKFRRCMVMRGQREREIEEMIFIRGVRLGMQLMLDATLERERGKGAED